MIFLIGLFHHSGRASLSQELVNNDTDQDDGARNRVHDRFHGAGAERGRAGGRSGS